MYVERNAGGQIAAAFLNEQFPGQEWLPIDNRVLQQFLAIVPRLRITPVAFNCRRRQAS